MLLKGHIEPNIKHVAELSERLHPDMIHAVHEYHQGNLTPLKLWESRLRDKIKQIQGCLRDEKLLLAPPFKSWCKSMTSYWCEVLLVLAWLRRKDYYNAISTKNT